MASGIPQSSSPCLACRRRAERARVPLLTVPTKPSRRSILRNRRCPENPQRRADRANVPENRMVMHPHDQYREKNWSQAPRNRATAAARPLPEQQSFCRFRNRYFQLEHKKRNGNRKHPVAKSLKSPCLFRFRCSIYHLVRQRRLLSPSGPREYRRPTKIQTQASPEGFVSPILKAGQRFHAANKKTGRIFIRPAQVVRQSYCCGCDVCVFEL